MTGYRPADLPELRAEMAQWAESQDAAEHWAKVHRDFDPEGTHAKARGMPAQDLRRAELFFVEPDMTTLAAHAAKSLPDLTLYPQDLPTPCGVMYSPEPLFVAGITRIHGAAWAPCRIRSGGEMTDAAGRTVARQAIWLAYLVDRDQHLERIADPAARARDRARLPRLHHLSPVGIWICNDPDADALDATHARGYDTNPTQVIKAAWVLMQQEGLARETEIGLDRATRKRLERAGVDETETRVRVIALRRPSKPAAEAGTSERDYHHQWIVRGHWRNQPYKTQGIVRPIWIAPHIKGPEGAPLLGGERILHWKQ
ncbi:MAG: hypothetical protein ACT4QF_09390 [Sporichthyaceae bacterium]